MSLMNWPKVKPGQRNASVMAYMLTFIALCAGIAIADVLTPFVSYYFSVGSIPDSGATTKVLDNLDQNKWGMIMASVCGLVLSAIIIIAFEFAGYVSLLLVLIEETAAYLSVTLFSGWLMWKYDPTTDTTVLTLLPFFLIQATVFIVLEVAAVLGQGGRSAKPYVALGCLVGAFVGIIRSTEQAFFYVDSSGNLVDTGASYGVAFGNSILDSAFFLSSSALSASCIARSKIGGTSIWHLVALILPTGMACVYSLYATFADYIPVVENEAGRYALGSITTVITLLFAVAVYRPIHQLPESSVPHKIPAVINSSRRPAGPIPVNAVVLV